MVQPRHPLVPSRGLTLVADFCRASGLEVADVQALLVDGRVDGVTDRHGRVLGLFDDALPDREQLRAWGHEVSDHYEPESLRTHEDEHGEDDEQDEEDDSSSWSITW